MKKCAHLMVVWLLCMPVTALLAVEPIQAPQFAYGVNSGDWSVTAYRVNPDTGKLSHQGHWYAGASAAAVAVHPAGFVISVSMTEDWLNVHRILKNGRLEKISQSPISAGIRAPFSISLHPSGKFVYVSARAGQVAGFRFDSDNGVLSPVPGSPFKAQRRTRSVTVHPSGKFVYASNAYDNSISAWRINSNTGALSPVPGSPFSTGERGDLDPELMNIIDAPPEAGGIPYMVAVHPSGRYLYVTNWMGPSISMFKVDTESGELSPLPGNPMLTGNSPYALAVHPSGHFVYVTSWDAQAVYGYAVNGNNGTLSELPDSPYYTGALNPIAFRFNASGSLAYVVNSGDNAISVFAFDKHSGGLSLKQIMRSRYEPFDIALSEGSPVKAESIVAYVIEGKKLRRMSVDAGSGDFVPEKEFQPGFLPRSVIADPQGHFIYLAGEKDGKGRLDVIRETPEGELKSILNTPYELGIVPVNLELDVSGHFLYLIDPDNEGLFVFSVNAKLGTLGTLRNRPPRTGKKPVAITIDPVARFSFVANADDNSVSVFTHRRFGSAAMFPIDQPQSKFLVGKNPTALAVDPTGKYLFVANTGDNSLSAFRIHFHNGSLDAFTGEPLATGKSPSAVVVHPDGDLVLVANRNSGSISTYHLDSLKSVLSAKSTIKVGEYPVKLKFDPTGRFVYVGYEGRRNLRRFRLEKSTGKLIPAGEANIGSVIDFSFHSAAE